MRLTWLVFFCSLECMRRLRETAAAMRRFWIIVAATPFLATAAQAGHSHGSRNNTDSVCPRGMHGGGCGNDANDNSLDGSNTNTWKPSSFNYSLTDDETKPPKRKYDYDAIPAFPPGSPGAADKIWKENGAPNGSPAVPNSGSNPHDTP
jgi:hypothetical protein